MYRPKFKLADDINHAREQLVMDALRQAAYSWPPRKAAERIATTKRGYRICAMCKKEISHKLSQLDHIFPVVPVDGSQKKGHYDWNVIINNMFVELHGWQVLCRKPCHQQKTVKENATRRKN